MIKVYFKKQSNYAVSSRELTRRFKGFLQKEGIVSDADVNLSLVGQREMKDLAKKYLREENQVHNVLSFSSLEDKETFVYPPDDMIHLGDVAVCFPKAVEEARRESKLVVDKVYELIEHGALHLLGKHHGDQ